MRPATQKPLPAVPRPRLNSQSLTTLSIDSQNHLTSLIRRLLSEHEEAASNDGTKEVWVESIHAGLVELGNSISRGGWLAGLRRKRRVQKAKRDREVIEFKTLKAKERKEREEIGKVKGKSKGNGPNADATLKPPSEWAKPELRGPFEKCPLPHDRCMDKSLAMEQIRHIVALPTVPAPKPFPKHLLLTVAPSGSRVAVPAEDSGFDLVPANISCVFTSGVYSLPDGPVHDTGGGVVLYGLDEWSDTPSADGDTLRIVGGTFTLKGVTSPSQYVALCVILRVSIYAYLSLLLEQHFLVNSGVELTFPQRTNVPLIPSPSLPGAFKAGKRDPPESKQSHRHAFPGTSILSYLSRKTAHILHRTTSLGPILGHGDSPDLVASYIDVSGEPNTPTRSTTADRTFGERLRRLSFPLKSDPTAIKSPEHSFTPFSDALEEIEKWRGLLSTSVGVSFAPPTLISKLAEKERQAVVRGPRGDEKIGLTTLMGWEGSRAKGMVGMAGFVRQQQLSLLYSQHVPFKGRPGPQAPLSGSKTTESSSLSSLSSSGNSMSSESSPCHRPRCVTFRYYTRGHDADKLFGEAISELCTRTEEPCDAPGCRYKRGQHQLRFIHNGTKIVFDSDVSAEDDNSSTPANRGDAEKILMWQSCKVCKERTEKQFMNDGTYLFSFAKFLELLLYSSALSHTKPPLCEHTSPPGPEDFPLTASRFNIIRHFSLQTCIISVSLSEVDVFEIQSPRLQIIKSSERSYFSDVVPQSTEPRPEESHGEERRVLRHEIKSFWECISDHLDKLEDMFVKADNEARRKALPRLPSVDDVYEPQGIQDLSPQSITQVISGLPDAATPSLVIRSQQNDLESNLDPGKLLDSMRQTFQLTEQSLYGLLSQTTDSSLNDVRRAFCSSAKGVRMRLVAWQNKHMQSKANGQSKIDQFFVHEPEWWSKGCHAVPGSNVIVREDDWGSIIAFTIGSPDYQRELLDISLPRSTSATPLPPPPSSALTNVSAFFSNQLFTTSTEPKDPDKEGIDWNEVEEYSAMISRKEHPRDPTSLLSLRDVLRHKMPTDGSNSARVSHLESQNSIINSIPLENATAPSAQSTHTSKDSIQGTSDPASYSSTAGTLSLDSGRGVTNLMFPALSYGSSEFEAQIREKKPPSVISVDSGLAINPDDDDKTTATAPPKEDIQVSERNKGSESATPTPSTFANTLTSGLSTAMRYMLNTSEQFRARSPFTLYHGLVSTENLTIDDRPHIKYEWTVGKRIRFSCTVYYAKQFDRLRRRCGIDEIFLKSMSRSTNWAAEGGKSRSNFWKTLDNRFVIKTLVNAWNVADLQVLIELGPSYFRYMDSTADKPTVLAKLLGFYTVEVKNLESGAIQTKADLLVMENLFCGRKVAKTFDLKGIQGRKSKASTNTVDPRHPKTMFDGEWIEGQQRSLVFVRPHSKVALREAIKSDSEFLAKSNIMDYSLLLGVDVESKEIPCGLVDTIGSYTFAKTLEHKAKQGLNSGKEITVLPPAEYQVRFRGALEGYFLACPDKWTKPFDDVEVISDPYFLPSVL